jgi:hypothetical protein
MARMTPDEVNRASWLIVRLRLVRLRRQALIATNRWRPNVHERLTDEEERIEAQLRELFGGEQGSAPDN